MWVIRNTVTYTFLQSEIGMDQVPDDQWAMMLKLIDTNQDGKISFGEYKAYSSKQQATQGDELEVSPGTGSGDQGDGTTSYKHFELFNLNF